ncbi:carbonic anhydrase [Ranunculus cassubicifolius]
MANHSEDIEFDYCPRSSKGPHNWGNLRPEWAIVNDGLEQSPIDISNDHVKIVENTDNLQINYKPGNAILRNRGHDIQLAWEGDGGSVKINGEDYVLVQCHWHSPSEHTIDGKKFALEQHCVHQRTDPTTGISTIAVIGILFDVGESQPFLTELEEPIKIITSESTNEVDIGLVDATDINISSAKYYRYMGSLTTPSCSEGVIWTIDGKVQTASIVQIELLKNAVQDFARDNARPLQPLNARDVFLYK